MVVTDGPPTLAARASRVWSRFVASVMAARAARRRKKPFLRRMVDDIFALGVLIVAAWVAVNLIAHLTN